MGWRWRWPPWETPPNDVDHEATDAAVALAAEALADAKLRAQRRDAEAARAYTLVDRVDRLTREVDRALRMRGNTQ